MDKVDAEVDIVAKVARMPLHRMGGITGVEMFEAERDAGGLRLRQNLLPGGDAVGCPLLLIHPVKAHPGKRDHLLRADLLGNIDCLGELGDCLVEEARIARPLGKAVARDERDLEPDFLDVWIKLPVDPLDPLQADRLGVTGELEGVHRIETPPHHGMADAVVADRVRRIGGGPRGVGGRRPACNGSGSQYGRRAEEPAAGDGHGHQRSPGMRGNPSATGGRRRSLPSVARRDPETSPAPGAGRHRCRACRRGSSRRRRHGCRC